MKDTVFTKTLEFKNGKLLRKVQNIDEFQKIIDVIKNKGLFGKSVIETNVYSKDEHIVEHEYINYIIHSGEYTESMGYDVQKYALDFGLSFFEDKIYGWDFLPHNFTYRNGNWFLYDFDSFSLNPKRLVTLLRGFFKITFSNYEILRFLTRREMSYYYLTRMRIEDIIKLIPFYRWLYLFINMQFCQVLYYLKQYKDVYNFLKFLFNQYTKNYQKDYYDYSLNDNEKELFEEINNQLENVKTAFCVGETASKWAIYNEQTVSNISKFSYIDDYVLCDKYYNFIFKNGYKNVSTAVLYPLVDDNDIDENIKYRALYDSYAQFRFASDAVISLDIDNVEALKNFTTNVLIIKSEKNLTEELQKYFNSISKIGNIFVAKNKKDKTKPQLIKKYNDGNRGPDAHRQTWEILKILNKKREI